MEPARRVALAERSHAKLGAREMSCTMCPGKARRQLDRESSGNRQERSPGRGEPWQWEEPAGQIEEWQQQGQQGYRPGH